MFKAHEFPCLRSAVVPKVTVATVAVPIGVCRRNWKGRKNASWWGTRTQARWSAWMRMMMMMMKWFWLSFVLTSLGHGHFAQSYGDLFHQDSFITKFPRVLVSLGINYASPQTYIDIHTNLHDNLILQDKWIYLWITLNKWKMSIVATL